MTYLFEIHYSIFSLGQHRGKGTGFVNAESAEQAEAAYRAEYPVTERFDYKITKIIVSASNLRGLAAKV